MIPIEHIQPQSNTRYISLYEILFLNKAKNQTCITKKFARFMKRLIVCTNLTDNQLTNQEGDATMEYELRDLISLIKSNIGAKQCNALTLGDRINSTSSQNLIDTTRNNLLNSLYMNLYHKTVGDIVMSNIFYSQLYYRIKNENYILLSGKINKKNSYRRTKNAYIKPPKCKCFGNSSIEGIECNYKKKIQKLNTNQHKIYIKDLLYSRIRPNNEGIPKDFVLKCQDSAEILEHIFGDSIAKNNNEQKSRYINLQKLIIKMIENNDRTNYAKILAKKCKRKNKIMIETRRVFGFTRAILKKLIPKELFGTSENLRVFIERVKQVLNSSRGDSFELTLLMNNIKLKNIKWIKLNKKRIGKTEMKKQKELLAKIVLFILVKIVFQIIRANFYVTENKKSKSKLIFYSLTLYNKKIIDVIKEKTNAHVWKNCKDLSENSSTKRVRFLPKNLHSEYDLFDIRPIISHRTNRNNTNSIIGVKMLKYISEKRKSPYSCFISTLKDMYYKILNFKLNSSSYNYYIAKLDFKNCFDNVDIKRAINIATNSLNQDEYLLYHLAQKRQRKYGLYKNASKVTEKLPLLQFENFLNKVFNNHKHHVFIDRISRILIHKNEFSEILTKENDTIFEINKKCYKQIKGVKQGSKLSVFLNNIYYNNMENEHMSGFIRNNPNIMLVRAVDDYLVISNNIIDCELLINKFSHISDYNYCLNDSKCTRSYRIECLDGVEINDSWIEYCGILINTIDLGIKINFNKFEKTRKKMNNRYKGSGRQHGIFKKLASNQ